MSEKAIRPRPATVRNAPRLVASSVVGRELASLRRRGLALAIDGVLCVATLLPAVLLLTGAVVAWHLHRQGDLDVLFADEESVSSEELDARRRAAVARFVERRRPSMLPLEVRDALDSGDPEALDRALEGHDFSLDVSLDSGESEPSTWDARERVVEIRTDLVFGRLSRRLGLVPLVVLWFTLVTRLMRGFTPGKWLLGVRIVRADGRPLSLWNSFGRAGGYGAGLATVGLGFLEAAWDPNRQALHDRAAGTFVVRAPRFGPRRRPGQGTASATPDVQAAPNARGTSDAPDASSARDVPGTKATPDTSDPPSTSRAPDTSDAPDTSRRRDVPGTKASPDAADAPRRT